MNDKIEFKGYALEQVDLFFPFLTKPLENQDINIEIASDFQRNENFENIYKVCIDLKVKMSNIEEFKINLKINGVFEIKETKDMDKLLCIDGMNALYGCARDIVNTLSLKSPGYPPIVLPIIDFVEQKVC